MITLLASLTQKKFYQLLFIITIKDLITRVKQVRQLSFQNQIFF